jgi:hypothetical protein
MAVVFFCGTSPQTESNSLRSGSPDLPASVMLMLRQTRVRPSLQISGQKGKYEISRVYNNKRQRFFYTYR